MTLTCHNIIQKQLDQASLQPPVFYLRNYELGFHNVLVREIAKGKWRIVVLFDLDAIVAVPLSAYLGAPMFSHADPRLDVVLFECTDMGAEASSRVQNYVCYLNKIQDQFQDCPQVYSQISELRSTGMLLVYLGLQADVDVNERRWLKRTCSTVGRVTDSDWEFLDDLPSYTDCSITSSSEFSDAWEEEPNSSCTSSDIEANGSPVSQESDSTHEPASPEPNAAVARLSTLAVSEEYFIDHTISDMLSVSGLPFCQVLFSWLDTFSIEIWGGRSVFCVNQDIISKALRILYPCDTMALMAILGLPHTPVNPASSISLICPQTR